MRLTQGEAQTSPVFETIRSSVWPGLSSDMGVSSWQLPGSWLRLIHRGGGDNQGRLPSLGGRVPPVRIRAHGAEAVPGDGQVRGLT
jgi:hypothetical protein